MIVFDTSALLAVALNEKGAGKVLTALPQAVLSSANLAEVLTVSQREGLDSEQIFADIVNLGVGIVPVEPTHARISAQISRAYPGLNLSLGDRLCLALALNMGAEVLTSDREMTRVRMGIKVGLFR